MGPTPATQYSITPALHQVSKPDLPGSFAQTNSNRAGIIMSFTVRRPIHHYSPTREKRWHRRAILSLLIIISAVIQSVGGGAGVLFHFRPDLVLIIVICWTLQQGPVGGWWAGLGGGLLSDIFTGGRFGFRALSLGISCWLVSLVSRSLYRGHLTTRILMVLFAVLIDGLIYYLLLLIFQDPPEWTAAWRDIIWPRLWQTVLISPLWLLPAERLLGGDR